MVAIRITVLKRALHESLVKAHSDTDIKPCEAFSEGQVFITGLNMPEGFCAWAWTDISRMVLALHSGGSFNQGMFRNWMKDGNSAIACCTDGFRPVTFKLERIDTKSLLDLSGLVRPAPQEAYDSERWGEFSYDFGNLEPGKAYTVRLHFCEVFHKAAGKRRFNVVSVGKRVLEDFDIFVEAGGAYKAIIREFNAVADEKGGLGIAFLKGQADYPKLSAIEIVPASADASAGASAKAIHAINSGGKASGVFSADGFFSGGNAVSG